MIFLNPRSMRPCSCSRPSKRFKRLARDPDHAGQIGLCDTKRHTAGFHPVFPLKMHEGCEAPPQSSIGRVLLDVGKRAHQDCVSLENQLGEVAKAARVLFHDEIKLRLGKQQCPNRCVRNGRHHGLVPGQHTKLAKPETGPTDMQ